MSATLQGTDRQKVGSRWARRLRLQNQIPCSIQGEGKPNRDVSIDEDCRQLATAALDNFGRIDVLVNNAGVTKFVPTTDLEGLSKADFEHIFGVNVVGAFQMTRAAVPALKLSGNGSIVNMSSYSGMSGLGSSIAYAGARAWARPFVNVLRAPFDAA